MSTSLERFKYPANNLDRFGQIGKITPAIVGGLNITHNLLPNHDGSPKEGNGFSQHDQPQFVPSSPDPRVLERQSMTQTEESEIKVRLITKFAETVNTKKYPEVKKAIYNALEVRCKLPNGRYIPKALDVFMRVIAKADPTIIARSENEIKAMREEKSRKAKLEDNPADNNQIQNKLSTSDFTSNILTFKNLSTSGSLEIKEETKISLMRAIINQYSKELDSYSKDSLTYKPKIPADHIELMLRNRSVVESKFNEVLEEVSKYVMTQAPYIKRRYYNNALDKFMELSEIFSQFSI